MAEKLSLAEFLAKHGAENADRMVFEVVDGVVNFSLAEEGNTATPIPPTETPTQAPTQVPNQVPPQTPSTPPTSGLVMSNQNVRRGGQYSEEYKMNGSIEVLDCDAGYHEIPDGFIDLIPEKSIWIMQGVDRVPVEPPYAKCLYITDEFSQTTTRTFVNIMGLARWGTPEWQQELNHGQYRAGGVCNRCMGMNSNGEQISKGRMTTRNIAFNWTFDKRNGTIPADMPFDGHGSYLYVRGLKLGTDGITAIPLDTTPNPFTS